MVQSILPGMQGQLRTNPIENGRRAFVVHGLSFGEGNPNYPNWHSAREGLLLELEPIFVVLSYCQYTPINTQGFAVALARWGNQAH